MKSSGIGGQAVMEGIMMKNQDSYAVAVRKADGTIAIKKDIYKSISRGHSFCDLPFIRGTFRMIDSLILGIGSLEFSTSFFEEEESSPSFLEKKLSKEKAEKVTTALSVILALFLSLGLFMVLPVWIAGLFRGVISSSMGIALLEGIGRVVMFIAYISLISLLKDIRRLYQYHGAEHKCINCIEHGLPLTVDNVRGSSKEHKRCGTSFLLFVMIVSIFVSIFIRTDIIWLRVLSRLLLLPVVMGVSYEFIRIAGNSEGGITAVLSKPGLWLQGLTTREPEDDMIQVAIEAVEAVFDWKAWQEKELGITYNHEKKEEII